MHTIASTRIIKIFTSLMVNISLVNQNISQIFAFSPSTHLKANHRPIIRINKQKIKQHNPSSLNALPWFQKDQSKPPPPPIDPTNSLTPTIQMMENHRLSQEASERTTTILEELSSTYVTGKSRRNLLGSGVKATFDGMCRPISVEVDVNFLFSDNGVVSVEELNRAVTEAVVEGYGLSCGVMEEKIGGLYEQLGLPREGGGSD